MTSVNVTVEEMESTHWCAAGQHWLLKFSKLPLSLQKERIRIPRRDTTSEFRSQRQIPGQPEKWSHSHEELRLPARNTGVTPMEHWDYTMEHWGHTSQALRTTPWCMGSNHVTLGLWQQVWPRGQEASVLQAVAPVHANREVAPS